MLLQLAPRGSFAALDADRIVGTAIGIDYGGFGWIAMMLVDPGFRGRGLGAALLDAAISALPPENPVRLDATPLGRPLYQRFGFADETTLTRHVAERPQVSPRTAAADERAAAPEPAGARDIARIAANDRLVFQGSRDSLLSWAGAEAPQYAWYSDERGSMSYCFGRRGRLFDQIGPVVAGSAAVACELTRAALSGGTGRATIIDAFDDEAEFRALLSESGFTAQRPLFRMCRGRALSARRAGAREFAIFGPEFA